MNAPPQTRPASPRLATLDGLRGVLVCVMIAAHLPLMLGNTAFNGVSQACVKALFCLSGLVLSRSYDGRYGIFLLRRVVRLWPVYAVGMLLGAAAIGRWPVASVMVWFIGWDSATIRTALQPNPPIWALCIYAWMMLLLPAVALFARGGAWRILLLPPAWAACAIADWHFGWAGWFMLGAWLSRFEPRFAPLETPVPQWLGQVGYSLFLVHWPLLTALLASFGAPGLALGVVALPVLAWVVWRFVERPSLAASRYLGGQEGSSPFPRKSTKKLLSV